jgi:REP element-mobilizing transposase RayT
VGLPFDFSGAMSLPRQYLPGSTYLVTRRCTRREFRLLPSRRVNQILRYCLAYAAGRFGIHVHTAQAMSNHWHLVVSDPSARLPRFLETAHKLIAKCMNTTFEWEENLWSCEKTSVVHLEDSDSILRKIVYALVNPPSAGLVRSVKEWSGFHTAEMAFGSSLTVKRPKVFFREDGTMPKEVSLELVRPDAFAWMDDAAFTELVRRRVALREREIQDEFRAKGWGFLGMKRCLKHNRLDRPRSTTVRGTLSPTVAGADEAIRRAALARRREFLAEYRDAYTRWREGDRDVVFPPGTYWLRVYAGVRCREPSG